MAVTLPLLSRMMRPKPVGSLGTSVNRPTSSPAASSRVSRVAASIRGTSPYNTSVRPSADRCGRAVLTAWPVPSCSVCSTQTTSRLTVSKTCSLPWPMTTQMFWGFREAAVSITRSTMGRPPMRCSTLGILEYMRVPLPAARMTILRGVADMGFFRRGGRFLKWKKAV